jgi:hypothetical protein
MSSVSLGRGRAVAVSRCKLCSGMAGRGGQGWLCCGKLGSGTVSNGEAVRVS